MFSNSNSMYFNILDLKCLYRPSSLIRGCFQVKNSYIIFAFAFNLVPYAVRQESSCCVDVEDGQVKTRSHCATVDGHLWHLKQHICGLQRFAFHRKYSALGGNLKKIFRLWFIRFDSSDGEGRGVMHYLYKFLKGQNLWGLPSI